MSPLLQLLARIRRRRAVYLCRDYICCLQAFIAGWSLEKDERELAELKQFESWLHQLFLESPPVGWSTVILRQSRDEHHALDYFFELLDQWQAELQSQQ